MSRDSFVGHTVVGIVRDFRSRSPEMLSDGIDLCLSRSNKSIISEFSYKSKSFYLFLLTFSVFIYYIGYSNYDKSIYRYRCNREIHMKWALQNLIAKKYHSDRYCKKTMNKSGISFDVVYMKECYKKYWKILAYRRSYPNLSQGLRSDRGGCEKESNMRLLITRGKWSITILVRF